MHGMYRCPYFQMITLTGFTVYIHTHNEYSAYHNVEEFADLGPDKNVNYNMDTKTTTPRYLFINWKMKID